MTEPSPQALGPDPSPKPGPDTFVEPDPTLNSPSVPASDHTQYPFLSPPSQFGDLGRLGGYRVQKLLGEGGMGFVFQAEDETLLRLVALKVMRPEVAVKAGARERFLREGRAAAALKSDFVTTIYQVGEANGVPFLAMEYLEGSTLDDWLKARPGPAPVDTVLTVARHVLLGLAAAHDKGLVHRDVKPSNLWMEAGTGRTKLLDFGLTRGQGAGDQITHEGAVVGTPAYMAPEQANGKGVDGRSDLFSVGCVLYRMLAGRSPFQRGSTLATLTALATENPVPPTALNAAVPPDLSATIMRLLAKDPAARPASATEVARLLAPAPVVETLPESPVRRAEFDFDAHDATQAEVPLASPAEPRLPSTGTRVRGRRAGLLVGVAALLLLVGGGGLAAYKLVFESKDGTLIVEINDRETEARFKNGELHLLDAEGNVKYTLRPSETNKSAVAPGDYKVSVVGADGLTLDTREFTMKRRGEVTVRVTARPVVVAKKDRGGKAVDLLALVDPKRDTVGGRWKLVDGKLVGGGTTPLVPLNETLQVQYTPPPEYDLTAVIELTGKSPKRTDGMDTQRLVTLLLAVPHLFNVGLDMTAGDKPVHGFGGLDGKYANNNETTTPGEEFEQGKPVRVECRVRRNLVTVALDGKERMRLAGDLTRLQQHDLLWAVPDKARLAIGVQNAEYRVHEWTVTPVVGAEPSPGPAPLTAAQRKALEWVLSVGGTLQVTVDGKSAKCW